MRLPFCKCINCESGRLIHKVKHHACCWAWRLAIIIPALHFILHCFGIAHPEVISFIP